MLKPEQQQELAELNRRKEALDAEVSSATERLQAECAANGGHTGEMKPSGALIMGASRWCTHCGADRKQR
ncbi:MAG: hypothetical protein WAX38_02495 [Minisyncoccia bacterium]